MVKLAAQFILICALRVLGQYEEFVMAICHEPLLVKSLPRTTSSAIRCIIALGIASCTSQGFHSRPARKTEGSLQKTQKNATNTAKMGRFVHRLLRVMQPPSFHAKLCYLHFLAH